eukprot:gene7027-9606_t
MNTSGSAPPCHCWENTSLLVVCDDAGTTAHSSCRRCMACVPAAIQLNQSPSRPDPLSCKGWNCADLTRIWTASFVLHTISFFVSWWISQMVSSKFRQLNFEIKAYWCSCIISGIHAAITAQGSVRWTLLNNIYQDGEYTRSVPEQDFYSIVSSSYFAYDLLLHCLMSWLGLARFRVPEMFIHHILGIICFTVAPNYPMSWICGMWLATELTGPFVNARFIITQSGYRHSPLYFFNGTMMALTFLVFRIIMPACFWYLFVRNFQSFYTALDNAILWFFIASGLTGTVLNIVWFRLIAKGLVRVIIGTRRDVKKDV